MVCLRFFVGCVLCVVGWFVGVFVDCCLSLIVVWCSWFVVRCLVSRVY